MKLWGCDIMGLPDRPNPHDLANIEQGTRLLLRVLTKEEARKELNEVIKSIGELVRVVFRDASCSASGVNGDRRLLPDFCHFEPEQTHPRGTEPFQPRSPVPYHPGTEQRRHTRTDDRGPAKAPKKAASGGSSGGSHPLAGGARPKGNPAVEGQEPTWDLGKMKMVKVRSWKGRTFIDIREWYVDKRTMDTKPGKKGITLTPEQYKTLKAAMPEIDEALQ